MPSVKFTAALAAEYQRLYNSCELHPSHFADVDDIIDRLLARQQRYQAVAESVAAPWYFVAAIHTLEAGQRFDRHLHNGDPLNARTEHVPAGRPAKGDPPFSWEHSAADALQMHAIDAVADWSPARLLYELERYNGWGYRLYHPYVYSPYLWGFSTHYSSGKYIADGTWSDVAVSRQCGAAVIIRRLEERGDIEPLAANAESAGPLLHYAERVIEHGEGLQRYLNTFDGISVRVDGWPGGRTSDAVERIFGFRLSGDPRD